jgi:hypothetical protein
VAHPSGFVPPAAGALVPQRPRFHLYLIVGGSLLTAAAIIVIMLTTFYGTKAPFSQSAIRAPQSTSQNAARATTDTGTTPPLIHPLIQSRPLSIQSLLPHGAKIVETANLPNVVGKRRALVLWMLDPSRHSGGQEYCGTSVNGDYWDGPARLSLIDPTTPALINTVKIMRPEAGDQMGDRFWLPFFVSNSYYHVPQPNSDQKGAPTILDLQDLTGTGNASQFVLFLYEACGIVGTSVFGYEQTSDRALQYPVEAERSGSRQTEYWVEQVFARKPDSPGYWNFTWYPGHGALANLHEEVTFDRERQVFIEKQTALALAPQPHQVGKPLLQGSAGISPQQIRYWRFTVEPSMTRVHVVGQFQASGGAGNDTEVIVADWGECQNWINGHQAQVLYASGKVTTGSLDVSISQAGTYCLAFSNKMALMSAKTVSGNISLQYSVP